MQQFPMPVKVGLGVLVACGFIGFLVPGAPLIFKVASPVGAVALGVALWWTGERNYRPLAIMFFISAALGAYGLWQLL